MPPKGKKKAAPKSKPREVKLQLRGRDGFREYELQTLDGNYLKWMCATDVERLFGTAFRYSETRYIYVRLGARKRAKAK